GRRVIEHIELPLNKPTWAMKLEARGRFFRANRFRLRTINLELTHYDMLMPVIERRLRDRLNPIVGKQ
ncbi:MAG TPA: hypothetical protein VLX90_02100, partial [Steroidobacteraceae bacterium]|nr:hypothetical protein [Steroidobacteraceae bacterium]